MSVERENWHGEPRLKVSIAPPGRYLLREDGAFKDPFEAEVVAWSAGGRVKIRYASGAEEWLEHSGIPFLVEALPTDTTARGEQSPSSGEV